LGKEEELEKLIRELRRTLTKISYRPRSGYGQRPGYTPRNYMQRRSYEARHDFRYHPEQNQKPKQERPSYHGGKIWTEPTPYRPEKERIVYDPEVKDLLRRIEKHLIESKPDAEEIVRRLESDPELYREISERLMERMCEDFRELIETENVEQSEITQKSSEAGEESGEDVGKEPENRKSVEEFQASEIDEPNSEERDESCGNGDLLHDAGLENEVEEMPEQGTGERKAIEEIESQDLSELEAELFSDVGIESMEEGSEAEEAEE
jgi:hypothetical protein